MSVAPFPFRLRAIRGTAPGLTAHVPQAFTELLGAAILFWLGEPATEAQRDRLIVACRSARWMMETWPPACRALAIAAQLDLDGKPDGIDKHKIEAATSASWSPAERAAHFAWQDRADIT